MRIVSVALIPMSTPPQVDAGEKTQAKPLEVSALAGRVHDAMRREIAPPFAPEESTFLIVTALRTFGFLDALLPRSSQGTRMLPHRPQSVGYRNAPGRRRNV